MTFEIDIRGPCTKSEKIPRRDFVGLGQALRSEFHADVFRQRVEGVVQSLLGCHSVYAVKELVQSMSLGRAWEEVTAMLRTEGSGMFGATPRALPTLPTARATAGGGSESSGTGPRCHDWRDGS
eukprot:2694851-Pyramimonas_sp.AAC.1